MTLDASVTANPGVTIAASRNGVLTLSDQGGKISGATVTGTAGRETVTIPTGVSDLKALVPSGSTVTSNLPILSGRFTGLAVQATVPAEKVYRLFSGVGPTQAQITNGPGPFDCATLGMPQASAAAEAEGQTAAGIGVVITCAAPRDLRILAGSPALMAITTGKATGVTTLPVEAVAGLSQRGRVTLVREDGTSVEQSIDLGITDGRYVEVKKGLSVGDRVSLPGPSVGES